MPDLNEGWEAASRDYQRRRRRTSQSDVGMLVFAVILVVVGLAGIGIVVWLVYSGRLGQSPMFPMQQYNRQVVGTQLAWRALADLSSQGLYATGMVAGNFDQDADPELVLATPGSGYRLLELDGTLGNLPGFANNYSTYLIAWDYEGDGVDELILEDYSQNPGLAVYSLTGQQLHMFPSMRAFGFSITGDYDGDDKDELLLHDWGGVTSNLYTTYGSVMHTDVHSSPSYSVMLADIDSDGLCELVTYENRAWSITGSSQTAQTPAWPVPNGVATPSFAGDLTGDGMPELVDPLQEIIDTTAQGHALLYNNPASGYPISQSGWHACTTFDDPQTGMPALVVIPDSMSGSGIYMFDPSGNLTYQQDLSPGAIDCCHVNYQGQDYLVVATSDRVMIYP